MEKQRANRKITIRDIALIGAMVAVIVVCKEALNFVPNVELVSFWIILFTLFFGWDSGGSCICMYGRFWHCLPI